MTRGSIGATARKGKEQLAESPVVRNKRGARIPWGEDGQLRKFIEMAGQVHVSEE